MEIAKVGEQSLKVKAKLASFIINPEKKIEDEIIILTKPPSDYSAFGDRIVISAPGEYEAAGVSIKGEALDNGICFNFHEEGQNLLILSSASLAKNADTEDANAVVAFLDGSEPEEISKIAADVVAVIGPEASLPQDRTNIKRTDKLNLKKTEEYKGFIVHLSK